MRRKSKPVKTKSISFGTLRQDVKARRITPAGALALCRENGIDDEARIVQWLRRKNGADT